LKFQSLTLLEKASFSFAYNVKDF